MFNNLSLFNIEAQIIAKMSGMKVWDGGGSGGLKKGWRDSMRGEKETSVILSIMKIHYK